MQNSAHPRPRGSTIPIALDWPPVAIVSAGIRAKRYWGVRIRSASDSSSRSTGRGSRWSACRATSCITGSSGGPRPCIGPISQDAPYSVGLRGAHRRRSERPGRRSAPRGRGGRSGSADRALTSLDTLVEERAAGFGFIARALGVVALIALVLVADGHLQPDGLPHRAAHAGDRRAHGARRRPVAGVRATTARALAITVAGRWSARRSRSGSAA